MQIDIPSFIFDAEADKQKDYRQEEEDEEEGNASCSDKSFFAPSDGTSFGADSFLQFNLSFPLLKACEALRVHSMIEKLARFTDIRCCPIVSGLSTKDQEAVLRTMPDIVVATPGRMIDHLRNSMSVNLDDLSVLIIDKADRFWSEDLVLKFRNLQVRVCPKKRKTMFFSATMTEKVDDLIKLSLSKPVRLSANPSEKRTTSLTEE